MADPTVSPQKLDPVARIRALVEERFDESSSKILIQTLDGHQILLDKSLRDQCSALSEWDASEGVPFETGSTETVILRLIGVSRGEPYPKDFAQIIELLSLAFKLGIDRVVKECVELFMEPQNGRPLLGQALPVCCSEHPCEQFMKAILELPLRTYEVYEEHFENFLHHCGEDRSKPENVLKHFEAVQQSAIDLEIEPLPVSLTARSVPVGLFREAEEIKSFVYYDNLWQPVNVFGKLKIDWDDMKSFYLSHGSYLLYHSASANEIVFIALTSKRSRAVVHRNAFQLLSKEDNVFVLNEEGGTRKIRVWLNFVFHTVYAGKLKGEIYDYDCKSKVLCFQRNSHSFSLMKVDGLQCGLISHVEVDGAIQSMYFLDGKLNLWRAEDNNYIRSTYSMNVDAISDEEVAKEVYDKRKTKYSLDGMRRKVCSGTLFETGCKEIPLPVGAERLSVCLATNCISLSELYLLPGPVSIPQKIEACIETIGGVGSTGGTPFSGRRLAQAFRSIRRS